VNLQVYAITDAPQVTSITPNLIAVNAPASVQIAGSGFGSNQPTVYIQPLGMVATVNTYSPDLITATLNASLPNVYTVEVINNGNFGNTFQTQQGARSNSGRTVKAACQPVLTGLNTDIVAVGVSSQVSIQGQCLTGLTVYLEGDGGGAARTFPFAAPSSDTQLTFSYTSTVVGVKTLYVKNASNVASSLLYLTVVSVTLSNTDPNYLPANILSDSCASGCNEPYTVSILPSTISGTVQFSLQSSALLGYATNACFGAIFGTGNNCTDPLDTAPDYFFDPNNITQTTLEVP
jgi:hypothetical protein